MYASDHNDQLPHASDIWDYIRQLAEFGNINDAEVLWSRLDPAADLSHGSPFLILAAEQTGKTRQLNPTFRQLKPSVAVALDDLNTKMPLTTPITWTRGLQMDGTWAAHSPYGPDGGYIVFMGGNVHFYHNLTDDGGQLTRFDGKGKTANILEALPPGSRIGEYVPTPEEQVEWASAVKWRRFHERYQPEQWLILIASVSFIAFVAYRTRKTKVSIARIVIWLGLILLIIAILFPSIS